MRLLVGLLFASCAFGQAHEILRPTVDSTSNNTALGCVGTNQTATSMPNARDSAGLATNSTNSVQSTPSSTRYKARVFSIWTTPTQSYTSLKLNVNSQGIETFVSGNSGVIIVSYSLNGGSSWTVLRNGGQFGPNYAQTTDSVALSTAQDFTKIQVGVCMESFAGGDSNGDVESIIVWDIWTDGTYSGAGAGSGSSTSVPAIQPIMVSAILRRRYVA